MRCYEINFERGVTYIRLKKYKLAIKDLQESLKYNHNQYSSICWIGEAYYFLNDTINAIPYLEEASRYGDYDSKVFLKNLLTKQAL